LTSYPDLFTALAAPFEDWEIRERKAEKEGSRMLAYVTSQAVKNRLDQVLGPEGWEPAFVVHPDGVECRLTVTLPDGSKLTKSDAGTGRDLKAAYSDALKRAAEMFGVGRYLRKMGVPPFARSAFGEPESAPAPLPRPAPRALLPPPSDVNGHPEANGNGQSIGHRNAEPRTGRALFAFVKEMEQTHEVGLLKYMSHWAKLQDFPGRMVDWDVQQVKLGVAEIRRKLEHIGAAT
jgi:hypothetical protein